MMGKAQQFFKDVVLTYEGGACLIWPHAENGIGYGVLGTKLVHRLVCEHFNGPPPLNMEAAHSCGNRRCCTPKHIRWKTHAENMADMRQHGTVNHGARNGAAKLTDTDVLAIRALSGRFSQRAIAKQFGVNQGTISDIVRREAWAHV